MKNSTGSKKIKAHTAQIVFKQAQKRIFDPSLQIVRERIGIPENGLKDEKKYRKWLEDNKNTKNFTELLRGIYIVSMQADLSGGYQEALQELILNGSVSNATLASCDISNCQLMYIEKEGAITMPQGLYIRVSPNASPSSIRAFVTAKNEEIDDYNRSQRMYKNPKAEYFLRNECIYWLSCLNISDLRSMVSAWGIQDIQTSPKDSIISRTLKKLLGITISTDSVRKITQREREKRNPRDTILTRKR